jgi:hypothetical protein
MLDNLKDMLKNLGQDSVVNNPDVPNDQNDAVLNSAEMSIINGLKKLISQGKGEDIERMASNPNGAEAQQLQSGFVQNLIDKLGIKQETANGIASSLIPQVLSKFQGNGGFDLQGLQSMLSKSGLDKDGDGDVDLGDFKKMLGL